jgi:two-component system sensor histidine kinase UhpB
LPASTCRRLEEILGIERVYTTGLGMDKQVMGGLSILLPRGQALHQRRVVETFANHLATLLNSRLSEETLRRSEEQYRNLFELSREAIVVSGTDGKVLDINPAALSMLGLKRREEALGHFSLQAYARIEQRTALIAELQAKGHAENFEVELVKQDGSGQRVYALGSAVLQRDERGRTTRLVATLTDITARKQAEMSLDDNQQALKEMQLKLRNLAAHLLHAREEERRKIAQEIHDELGGIMTALKMDLQWTAKRIEPKAGPLKKKIAGLIDLSDQTIGIVQRISSELRPRMLDDLGLAAALDWLGKDFTRRTGLPCQMITDFPDDLVGTNAATAFYRIVQEALTNIARHARASRVWASIRVEANRVELRVQDDGIGISEQQAASPGSYGLIGLRERVQGMAGDMRIEGQQGRGTILWVTVPLPHRGRLA